MCDQNTLKIIITLTEATFFIFFLAGVENLLEEPGMKPTTLHLRSQSGPFDYLAMATPIKFYQWRVCCGITVSRV